jgi:RNA polymerase sigma factor (sigma-70 family)
LRLHQFTRQHPRYDLDLAALEDEQLVVLVQECGYVPARDELISRCTVLKDRFIHWRAARSGLQEADRMDAQQDGVLWILEAIREYDTGQQLLRKGCRFRTYLYRVLLSRFIDVLRRKRRRQARLLLGGYASCSLRSPPAPQRGTERDELMARLHRELERLGGRAPDLWDLLLMGMRLRAIAATLELSYDAAKRLRRKLIAHLRARLGGD